MDNRSIINAVENSQSIESAEKTLTMSAVIELANKKFISGYDNNRKFRESLKANHAEYEKINPSTYILGQEWQSKYRFPQYKDDAFPDYNANRIKGTNFIAAAGPAWGYDGNHTGSFLHSICFNKQLKINEIIALGRVFAARKTDSYNDFYDYCSAEVKEAKFDVSSEKSIKVFAERISGVVTTNTGGASDQRSPHGMVQSKLTLNLMDTNTSETQVTDVNVTMIKMWDNEGMSLIPRTKSSTGAILKIKKEKETSLSKDEQKEVMWKLFCKSLSEPILVHCASGVGRTGHIIFMFELLKYYHEIMQSQQPEKIVDAIHAILNRIRENRPALVSTAEQFATAIFNAEILYQFALEKGYIKENMPVYESAQLNNAGLLTKFSNMIKTNLPSFGLFSNISADTSCENKAPSINHSNALN